MHWDRRNIDALEEIQRGNLEPALDLITAGNANPEIIALVKERIKPQPKRGRGRPRKRGRLFRRVWIGQQVERELANGEILKNAVADVMRKLDRKASTVWNGWSEWKRIKDRLDDDG